MRITDRTVAVHYIDCDPIQADMVGELLDEALEAAVLCLYAELQERGLATGILPATISGISIMPTVSDWYIFASTRSPDDFDPAADVAAVVKLLDSF
jgi:hypothetical protein